MLSILEWYKISKKIKETPTNCSLSSSKAEYMTLVKGAKETI